jgi:hypothetical protein
MTMDKESTAPPHPAAADAAITKYDSAKKALAEARSIDEVKDIRDKAVALRSYAMQARDRELIDHATEIRLRAERRAGELLKQMEKNQGGVAGKTGSKGRPVLDSRATLADLKINKSQSSRWQKLADMSKDKFEEVVTRGQQKASAAIDRAQNKPKPNPRSRGKQSGKRDKLDIIAACVSEVELIVRAAIAEIRDKEARAGLAQQLSNALQAIFAEALDIHQRYIEQQAATEQSDPEPPASSGTGPPDTPTAPESAPHGDTESAWPLDRTQGEPAS